MVKYLGFQLENEVDLVGDFSPTHLKNMLVKLDHETPTVAKNSF